MKTLCTAVVMFVALTRAAGAQWIRGADAIPAGAVAESLTVLRGLNDAVRKSPNDAALRYRVGLLAWTLAVRDGFKPSVGSLNGPLLKSLADSSLRLAVQMDPKSGQYELTLSRFLRASSDAVLRLTAPVHVDRAVTAARAGRDTALLATTLTEAGRLAWLLYDSESFETPPSACPGLATSIEGAGGGEQSTEGAVKSLHNSVATCMRPDGQSGEIDYLRAEDAFREAYKAIPNDSSAFRRVAMLLAEKSRWTELASMARDRVTRIPNDGWAWLTLGLALHRSGQSTKAVAVFDTASARLAPTERQRLFAFERLLQRGDSAAYATAAADRRTSWERAFWTLADPLWSREGNDPRTEFLARVTFAELRWTVEEMNVRGADSDRGEIHIRYGPPNGTWTFRCQSDIPCGGGPTQPQIANFMSLWDYDMGLTFVFWGAPSYGTAQLPGVDGPHVDRVISLRPATFDNVAAEKIIDMPLRLLRFRATGDSVDVLAMSQTPMAAVRAVTNNAVVSAHGWMLNREKGGGVRDSSVIAESGLKRAIYRVAPATYLYRVEATASGTMVAGRASATVIADRDTTTGFSLRGFGISDLLLGAPANPDSPLPARWKGLAVAPLLGVLPRQANLDVIWETYELGARDGQSQYTVAITFQRSRSRSGKLAATLLGVAASAAGVDRRDDRVTFKFDRAMTAAPAAFVDRVSLATGDTPPGDYIITLEITDKISGRATRRSMLLTIAQ